MDSSGLNQSSLGVHKMTPMTQHAPQPTGSDPEDVQKLEESMDAAGNPESQNDGRMSAEVKKSIINNSMQQINYLLKDSGDQIKKNLEGK